MDSIILVGAGGHSKSCIDVIECADQYRVAGLIDNGESSGGGVLGYPVIGSDVELKPVYAKVQNALVAVGQIKTPDIRIRLYEQLMSIGYNLPVIKSPSAYLSKHSTCGRGTIVLHGSIVNARAEIGHNCIVNTRSLIEHDVSVGDHCHISTGAVLNGGVRIGHGTFIGSGTVIKEGVTIGSRCVIGAGCVIKKDLPPDQSVQE